MDVTRDLGRVQFIVRVQVETTWMCTWDVTKKSLKGPLSKGSPALKDTAGGLRVCTCVTAVKWRKMEGSEMKKTSDGTIKRWSVCKMANDSMLITHTHPRAHKHTRNRGRFFFRGADKLLKVEANMECNHEGGKTTRRGVRAAFVSCCVSLAVVSEWRICCNWCTDQIGKERRTPCRTWMTCGGRKMKVRDLNILKNK